MKEFSNDPTKNIQQLSQIFENTIQLIQSKNTKLKLLIDQSTQTNQILQHYRLIQQYLAKALTNQVNSFKNALKEHQKNIEERNKRIGKYGNTSSSSAACSSSTSSLSSSSASTASFSAHINPIMQNTVTAQYAMFQTPTNTVIPPPPTMINSAAGGSAFPTKNSSLTHRKGPQSTAHLTNGNNNNHQSHSQQTQQPFYQPVTSSGQMMKKDDQRLRQAEKAEASIKQMGQLFTQMATLISEQSEVILRIEDDVEAGYSNTIEGYKNLENVYSITKGNRSMILKIFAIIILFVFLFLVWT